VTFRVQDSGGLADTETVTITVTAANRAPVLATIGAKSVVEGSALSFVISATDADGGTLTYSATGLPTGATFNATTRTFAWTPGTGTAGTYNVTFRVQDSGGLSDTEIVAVTVTASSGSSTLNEGLAAHWTMNDNAASTTITDASSNALHGAAQQNSSLISTAGQFNTAIYFNGVSDQVACGNSATLLPSAWTVSAWVKCEDTVTSTLLSFGNYRASIKLQNNSAGRPAIVMGGSNYRTFDPAAWTKLKDGQWHHVAFTLPGDAIDSIQSAKMYLDGTEVSVVATVAGGVQTAKTELFLGNADATSAQRFKGAMDEVRLYNRVLTAQEVMQLFTNGQ
jgi:hypothetical protein